MHAGKAAFATLDLARGATHYIAALQVARSFDGHDARYDRTLAALADFSELQVLKGTTAYWQSQRALAERLPQPSSTHAAESEEALEALRQREHLDFMVAEPFLQQAIAITEEARGPGHPSLLLALANLGRFYDGQGRYREAVLVYTRFFTLAGQRHPGEEAMIDLKPTGLGIDQTYFALMIRGPGRAEALLQYALQSVEKTKGPDHPALLTPLTYLGHLYKGQGRTSEAEQAYHRAVQISAQQYHKQVALRATTNAPDAARAQVQGLRDQAALYAQHGQRKGAAMTRQAAQRMVDAQNPQGVDEYLGALIQMALFYREQQRWADAETLYLQVLHLGEQAYDPESIKVDGLWQALAGFYSEQKRYADAEPFYKRVVTYRQAREGVDHRDVAWPLHVLGQNYLSQNRPADAEPLFHQALTIAQAHDLPVSDIAQYRQALGETAHRLGRSAEAEQWFTQALKEMEQRGADSETIEPRRHLAQFYVAHNRLAEAEALYKRNVELAGHDSLGSLVAHPLTALAEFYRHTRRFAEAEEILQRALAIAETEDAFMGRDSEETVALRTKLTELKRAQGREP